MVFNHYDLEIERYSAQFGVEANFVRAIIQQESNWDIYAMRYEPEWSYFFPFHSNSTADTETALQQFSYGLGQLMGSVYRELGYKDSFGQIFNVETQIFYLCKNLEKISNKTKKPDEIFACYNGGVGALLKEKDGKFPNQAYVDSAMSHLISYRGKYGD